METRTKRMEAEDFTHVVGASILPFMRDPKYNSLLFILGRERADLRYHDSGTWGDFSGRQLRQEHVIDTAAREVWEETLGVMRFSSEDSIPVCSSIPLANRIRQGEYAMRLVFKSRSDRAQYVTYIIEVPFDPRVVRRFERIRQRLKQHRKSGHRRSILADSDPFNSHPAFKYRQNSAFLEKSELGIFGHPILQEAACHPTGLLINNFDSKQYLRPTALTRIRVLICELTEGRLDLTRLADPHVCQSRSHHPRLSGEFESVRLPPQADDLVDHGSDEEETSTGV